MTTGFVKTTNVTAAILAGMFETFSTAFMKAHSLAVSKADLLAMRIPSGSAQENHSWLGQIPNMKKWTDERVLENFAIYAYSLINDDFEATVQVKRNSILDDQLGGVALAIKQMGRNAKIHADILLAAAMAAGWAAPCYDGKYFFATDHPIEPASGGAMTTQPNTDGGSGTAWYLMCLDQEIKPFIHQVRQEVQFTAQDKPDDEEAFMRKIYRYGADDRKAVGYGLYQMCWASKQDLSATYLKAAYEGILGMMTEKGIPMGLVPTHLVVPPSLWEAGRKLVARTADDAGAGNIYDKVVALEIWPYLATT